MALAVAVRRQTLAVVPSNDAIAAIAQACYAAWFYVLKTALPTGLAAVYPAPRSIDWREPRFLAAIVATAAVTAALILARRRQPGLLVAWLAYLAILRPTRAWSAPATSSPPTATATSRRWGGPSWSRPVSADSADWHRGGGRRRPGWWACRSRRQRASRR